MDGMLFAAFFFPLVLGGSILLSILAFLFSIWAGLGEELADLCEATARTGWARGALVNVLRNPPLKAYGWFVYPLALNVVQVCTVIGSYSLGTVLYRKRGWRFAQPLRGGLRFVMLQSVLWTLFAIAVALPWLSLESIGLLTYLGAVPNSREDRSSFGGLLVSAAALGMVSESLVVVALMVFDSSSKALTRRDLRSLETGNWNWHKMFGESSGTFWWLFISMQCSMALYSCAVAFLAEGIHNRAVQVLMMTVVVALLSVAVALTNAVGGKWRHGEVAYHLYMPFRGGRLFMLCQALGWMCFAGSLLAVGARTFELAMESDSLFEKGVLGAAGVLGFLSQLFIALSLLFFDPNQAGRSFLVKRIDQLEAEHALQSAGEAVGGQANAGVGAGADLAKLSSRTKAIAADAALAAAAANAATHGDVDGACAVATGVARSGGSSRTCIRRRTGPAGPWIIDSVIGKRASPTKAGALELLVQWKAPDRSSAWIEEDFLVTKVGLPIAQAAVTVYERQQARLGHDFAEKEEEELAVEEEKEDEEDERSRRRSGPRGRRRRSRTPAARRRKPSEGREEDHEWEECEDEMGNVFFYCLTTGKTVHAST